MCVYYAPSALAASGKAGRGVAPRKRPERRAERGALIKYHEHSGSSKAKEADGKRRAVRTAGTQRARGQNKAPRVAVRERAKHTTSTAAAAAKQKEQTRAVRCACAFRIT